MTTQSHEFEYTVDDESQSTTELALTPVQILEQAGIDPANHYLIEIRGDTQKSYEDEPDTEIHMHEKMKFISVSTGPTPVS